VHRWAAERAAHRGTPEPPVPRWAQAPLVGRPTMARPGHRWAAGSVHRWAAALASSTRSVHGRRRRPVAPRLPPPQPSPPSTWQPASWSPWSGAIMRWFCVDLATELSRDAWQRPTVAKPARRRRGCPAACATSAYYRAGGRAWAPLVARIVERG